jgi:hypothetical protein
MRDNCCPNCENDIATTVTSTIVAGLEQGETGSTSLTCPHCDAELTLTVTIAATLSQIGAAVVNA